jgi:SPP1 family predicted phage head-tail adaptor
LTTATLRAGDLRESVVVEIATESTNSYGEYTLSWAPLANRRAAVRGLRTDEVMSAQDPYTVATHEVEFRYLASLKASMRLVWVSRTPSRVLDIISITEQGNRESQRLVCKEQVS